MIYVVVDKEERNKYAIELSEIVCTAHIISPEDMEVKLQKIQESELYEKFPVASKIIAYLRDGNLIRADALLSNLKTDLESLQA